MRRGQKNRRGWRWNVVRGNRLGARVIASFGGPHYIYHCNRRIGKGTFQAALGWLEKLGYQVSLRTLRMIKSELGLQRRHKQGDD